MLQRLRTLPTNLFIRNPTSTTTRAFSQSIAAMAVEKTVIKEGSGDSPAAGDTVTMVYTGWLKDASQPENKGKQFDSSVGKADFVVQIGVGQVIKGWDEGVVQMKKGEVAMLDITSDYGYGDRGFPGAIPPKADLLFQVELKNFTKK